MTLKSVASVRSFPIGEQSGTKGSCYPLFRQPKPVLSPVYYLSPLQPPPTLVPRHHNDIIFSWEAAAGSSVAKLRWLLSHGVRLHGRALDAALTRGNVPVVSYLVDELQQQLNSTSFSWAVASGSIPMVTWLRSRGCPMDSFAYAMAGARGDVRMVRWLVCQGRCPWDQGTVGDLIRKWPRCGGGEGCGAGDRGEEEQEQGQGQEQVQEQEEENVGVEAFGGSFTGRGAAGRAGGGARGWGGARGCLEAVRLLAGAGCPLGGAPAVNAACELGELALVVWLVEQGVCGFNGRTLVSACAGGCEAVVEYVVGAGCPVGRDSGVACVSAVCEGDLATVACLGRLGLLRPGEEPHWARGCGL